MRWSVPLGSPIGLIAGMTPARGDGIGERRERRDEQLSQPSSPSRDQGAAAARSVAASTSRRSARPASLNEPSSWRSPRSRSARSAASHSSSVKPRDARSTSRVITPAPTSVTWASIPLSCAHTSAATWPSPRNSRSVVSSCQVAASGSSGSAERGVAGGEAAPVAAQPVDRALEQRPRGRERTWRASRPRVARARRRRPSISPRGRRRATRTTRRRGSPVARATARSCRRSPPRRARTRPPSGRTVPRSSTSSSPGVPAALSAAVDSGAKYVTAWIGSSVCHSRLGQPPSIR